MPKVTIREYDKTGVVQKTPISNIVYMPIITTEAIALLNSKGKVATLCSSRKELAALVEDKIDSANVKSILGYNIAKKLIDLGFQVLVEGTANGEISSDSPELLKDKGLFDIRFLTAGYKNEANFAALLAVANARQDCVALLCADEDAENFSYDVADVRAKFATASLFAAAFTPWFESKDATLCNGALDGDETSVVIPAAYGYLFAYGWMLGNGIPEWNAVAGPQRGRIPELFDVLHDYRSGEVEILQSRAADREVALDDEEDNVGIAINPICNVRPNGYIIFGNRTLKDNDAVKKTTAQSFLNVRNGVNAVKKALYEASRKFVFEQNTDLLWINFQNYVTPLLDKMQSGGGILGYTFAKVKTDAKARLRAKLTIIPVEAVEDFELDVYLVDDLTVTEE